MYEDNQQFNMSGKRVYQSDDAINLVSNLYKALSREKSRKTLITSMDRVIERICNYVGLSRGCIRTILKKKEKTGDSSKMTPKLKSGKKVILDSFDRGIINRKIQSMYGQKIAPTVSKIQTQVQDTIRVSKTTLAITLLDMGYTYRKRGDNRPIFNNTISITNDRINYLRKIKQYRDAGFQIVYLDETWVNKNHCSDYICGCQLMTPARRTYLVVKANGSLYYMLVLLVRAL